MLSSMARSGLPRACSAINGRSAAVAALHAATAAVPPCRRGLREIREKIFTLTLDNASNNTTACELLVIDCKYDLMFGGDHLHVRCCAHILNILVQDGMKIIHSAIKMIRELLKHIDSSPSRLQAFNSIANGKGVASKAGVYLDVPTRWNSTYKMIREASDYKAVLNAYASKYLEVCPSEEEWMKESIWISFSRRYAKM